MQKLLLALVLIVAMPVLFLAHNVVNRSDVSGNELGAADKQSGSTLASNDVKLSNPAHVKGGDSAIHAATNYPENMRDSGIHAKVFMNFTIEINGRATDISMDRIYGNWSSDWKHLEIDAFKTAATAAIENMEFVPARSTDGHIVSVQMTLPIEFVQFPREGNLLADPRDDRNVTGGC